MRKLIDEYMHWLKEFVIAPHAAETAFRSQYGVLALERIDILVVNHGKRFPSALYTVIEEDYDRRFGKQ